MDWLEFISHVDAEPGEKKADQHQRQASQDQFAVRGGGGRLNWPGRRRVAQSIEKFGAVFGGDAAILKQFQYSFAFGMDISRLRRDPRCRRCGKRTINGICHEQSDVQQKHAPKRPLQTLPGAQGDEQGGKKIGGAQPLMNPRHAGPFFCFSQIRALPFKINPHAERKGQQSQKTSKDHADLARKQPNGSRLAFKFVRALANRNATGHE